MNIITPITTSATLAFMPSYRWTPQTERASEHCRAMLRVITEQVAARYAREQAAREVTKDKA